jgi:hypothetical protein
MGGRSRGARRVPYGPATFLLAIGLSYMWTRWHRGSREAWRLYCIIMFAGLLAAVVLLQLPRSI